MRGLIELLLFVYLLCVKLLKLLKFAIVINLIDLFLVVQLFIKMTHLVLESAVGTDQLFKLILLVFVLLFDFVKHQLFFFSGA